MAKYIYETAAAEGKRVQALGGAKNHLVVMPDADMPKSVEAIIGSAFGAAGERCLAGSVLVAGGRCGRTAARFAGEQDEGDDVSATASQGAEMGPLVTADHRKKVVGYIEKGVAEGADAAVDGRESRNRRRTDSSSARRFSISEAGHDDRTRGDLRTGTLGDSREDAGRSDRPGEQLAVRQCDVDLHPSGKSAREYRRGAKSGWSA